MYNILLSYLVVLPSMILCFFPIKDQLRYSRRRTALAAGGIWIVTAIIFSTVGYRTGLDENIFIIPLFLLYFFVYQRCLTVHRSKSLAVFCSSIALISILTNISNYIAEYIAVSSRTEVGMNAKLIQFALSVVFVALLAPLYLKYGAKIVNETHEPRIWYTLVLISAAFFAINMLILPIEAVVSPDLSLDLCMILSLISLLVVWFAMQAFFYFIIMGVTGMYRTRERIHILELQENQFAAQQRYIKASEKVRHDFRQSIRTLSELYESGNLQGLGEYLREYVERMPTSEVKTFCGNTALNALLNYYVYTAEQNRIELTLQIRIPEVLPVSDVDLCNIIGNILDNAVTACQRAEEKFIRLSVIAEDGVQLYIVAVNSFDGNIRRKNEQYLSTSRTGEGLGLSSVTSTVEEYGGVAQFSHEDRRFFSNIAIPLQ